jgi:hypothetical protein
MSTRNISWRVKAGGAYGWQPFHLHVPIVLKSGSLNLLETTGPVQASNGIALPFAIKEALSINLCRYTDKNYYVIGDKKNTLFCKILQNCSSQVICVSKTNCKNSYRYKCHDKIDKIIFESVVFLNLCYNSYTHNSGAVRCQLMLRFTSVPDSRGQQ